MPLLRLQITALVPKKPTSAIFQPINRFERYKMTLKSPKVV